MAAKRSWCTPDSSSRSRGGMEVLARIWWFRLYRIFPKLGITSRAELAAALGASPGPV